MPKTRATTGSLLELLNHSSRPVYAIDSRRRIVYCNEALAAWLELEPDRVVGRLVEYHSEPIEEQQGEAAAPLADLCPPPRALSGEPCSATISCAGRDGRLAHRRADFIPLVSTIRHRGNELRGVSVLILLGDEDLSAEDLTTEITAHSPADELHRIIRRFRRTQAASYSIDSLLGSSAVMQKVRVQVAAAAASGANTLILGRPGTGRRHIARAIYYRAAAEPASKLFPVDCRSATEDQLRRAFESLRVADDPRNRPTLLLENLDRLNPQLQSQLVHAITNSGLRVRLLATCGADASLAPEAAKLDRTPLDQASPDVSGEPNTTLSSDDASAALSVDRALINFIATITITTPRLAERLDDLPVLAQCFLEACNRDSGKQVGSLRADALDQLALHSWPGELDELREAIAAAHTACDAHEITSSHLPDVIHHAAQAASRPRKRTERIVLDDLLAQIEREAIVRALAQADGNKTEAADLLGMTRPRLYRRLVQLGLVSESKEPEPQLPEFIEQPGDDEPQ
jgi:transcriptional regulator of aromatic amino acid metabolism